MAARLRVLLARLNGFGWQQPALPLHTLRSTRRSHERDASFARRSHHRGVGERHAIPNSGDGQVLSWSWCAIAALARTPWTPRQSDSDRGI
jgi:hypothetical protein